MIYGQEMFCFVKLLRKLFQMEGGGDGPEEGGGGESEEGGDDDDKEDEEERQRRLLILRNLHVENSEKFREEYKASG